MPPFEFNLNRNYLIQETTRPQTPIGIIGGGKRTEEEFTEALQQAFGDHYDLLDEEFELQFSKETGSMWAKPKGSSVVTLAELIPMDIY